MIETAVFLAIEHAGVTKALVPEFAHSPAERGGGRLWAIQEFGGARLARG